MSLFDNAGSTIVRELLKMPAQVAAYASLLGVVAVVMLSFGFIPQIFGGFARASRVNRIAVELNAHVSALQASDREHWANQAADALLRMDQARCQLPGGRLRKMYDDLIQDRMQEYYDSTRQLYPLLPCRDL